jgi:hypothetical protein
MNTSLAKHSINRSGIIHILTVAALLSLFWFAFLQLSGIRASLGESNFQSNIIRVDDYFYGREKEAALVGTSITGRILPEYFQEQGVAVANLGLDGCIPRTGIELVLKKRKLPVTVFVEARNDLHEPRGNDMEILGFVEGITFKLGRWLPLMRADERPSSMLYSWIKKKNDARQNPQIVPVGIVEGGKSDPDSAHVSLSTSLQTQIEVQATADMQNALATLLARGVHVVLMRLPVGGHEPRKAGDTPDVTDRLAAALSLEVLDVASILREHGIPVAFSDGTHMIAPSAREAAKVICEKLKTKK